MEELSIEEKAKAYDSIFERLKEMYNNNKTNVAARLIYERYFPELKESEDERIRKELLQIAKESEDSFYMVMTPNKREKLIAWLEKQGEQKPVNTDYISRIRKEFLSIEDNAENINGLTESQWVAIRAAHRLLGECIAKEQTSAAWSEDDEKKLLCICAWIKDYPRIADFKDEMYTVANNYIEWLKNLRWRVQPQPKQGWNKEDEVVINHLLAICAASKRYRQFAGCLQEDITKYQTWLKSLKDRVQLQSSWKPSELQIEALAIAIRCGIKLGTWEEEALKDLIEQLKKLMEE